MKLLRVLLAFAAIAFVVWMVPVADRCWDPRVPTSTRVAVSRDASGCVLHVASGDVHIEASDCAALRCEPGLASTFTHVKLSPLFGLLGLYGLATLAWAARWRSLLGIAGVDRSIGHVWRVSIEAQAGGVLLPGGIGGDALRVASMAQPSADPPRPPPPLSIVVASVLLDRVVGLSVVAAVAALLAFAWGGDSPAAALATGLALLPFAFLGGMVVLRRAPFTKIPWLMRGRVGNVVRPVLDYARHPGAPRAIAVAALFSVVVAGAQFAVIRGLVFALGATPSPPSAERWVYLGTAMAFVVSALPALPGAWGTADAAYVFFLGDLAGLGRGTALAVCLLYRLFWYLSGVAGAVLHLVGPRPPPAPERRDADPPA